VVLVKRGRLGGISEMLLRGKSVRGMYTPNVMILLLVSFFPKFKFKLIRMMDKWLRAGY
jgi:hypothetical protein